MAKLIFNSVGSNYTYNFAFKTFFARKENKTSKLIEFLNKKYSGKTTLFYKGREAILYALKSSGLMEGSKVIICAYTCAVVPTAVKNAGLVPVYADIKENSLDFGFEEFKAIADNDRQVKAVIIQNTLGFTNSISEIENYCKEKGIILIEDLAHSAGAKYPDGREVGTVGDFTVLSFSQDKIIDAISGGALITRTKNIVDVSIDWKKISSREQTRDRMYPLRTCKIRSLYRFGIGKFIHYLYRKMHKLSLPVYALDNKIEELPGWYAGIILDRFETLASDIVRRQSIAKKYLEAFPDYVHNTVNFETIERSTCLRIPILVENRSDVVNFFESKGIYISDIWYDVPVSPKKYWYMFENENKAVNSKNVASKMINFPTHMTLEDTDVDRIISVFKSCKK